MIFQVSCSKIMVKANWKSLGCVWRMGWWPDRNFFAQKNYMNWSDCTWYSYHSIIFYFFIRLLWEKVFDLRILPTIGHTKACSIITLKFNAKKWFVKLHICVCDDAQVPTPAYLQDLLQSNCRAREAYSPRSVVKFLVILATAHLLWFYYFIYFKKNNILVQQLF